MIIGDFDVIVASRAKYYPRLHALHLMSDMDVVCFEVISRINASDFEVWVNNKVRVIHVSYLEVIHH